MNERLIAQAKQRFSSEILWHFVSRKKKDKESIDRIIGILNDGLKVGEKPEKFKYFDSKTNEIETLEGLRVSCLADIPFKDLIIHAERYGQYAIGFHKSSANKSGFNPVLYVNQISPWFHNFIRLRNELEEALPKADKNLNLKFQNLLFLLGAGAKSGLMLNAPKDDDSLDEIQLNNYYYEREWRNIQDWEFKKEDVALIIVPDNFVNQVKYEIFERAKEFKNILVVPFTLIYRL